MSTSTLITLIVAVLGSSGVGGAIVAFLKVKPEAGRIVIDSAQGAVVVQSGVITDLRNELARKEKRIKALELERERDRQRITSLERRLAVLQTEVHQRTEEP